jgi:hypothetical protein
VVTQHDENDENDVLANILLYIYSYVTISTRGFIGELVMVVMCNDNSVDVNELQSRRHDVLSPNMNMEPRGTSGNEAWNALGGKPPQKQRGKYAMLLSRQRHDPTGVCETMQPGPVTVPRVPFANYAIFNKS